MDNLNSHSDVLLHLLKNRPHAVGAEIGVHTGTTTGVLLNGLKTIQKYYAIDPWKSYKQYDGSIYRKPGNKKIKTWGDAYQEYLKTISPFDCVITIKSTSVEACKKVYDKELDWVFIDANHEYEYIKENLKLWIPKVKKGGFVSGHDYGNKWSGIKKSS